MNNVKPKIKGLFLSFFAFLVGCSQPVLESPECIESRDSVKKFYSYHFGNDMKPTAKNLEKRKRFLSEELKQNLEKKTDNKTDYFTQADQPPKAFRVGKCKDVAKEKTQFDILLFWRTEEENIEREIQVEAIKKDNKWLINQVKPKN